MPNAHISGTGFYVPPKVVTNQDMTAFYDTSDEWITERSGIQERHWVEEGTGPSDMAVHALTMALDDAGLDKSELDFVVFATLSPECWFPGSGVFLQAKMGLGPIGILDVRQQCTGFVYGLSVASLYVKAGIYKNVAVIGAEVQSTTIDKSPEGRTVGVLFGDGAGACILSASDEPGGVLSTHLHADGNYAEQLWVPEPTSKFNPKVTDPARMHAYMNGREVFKHAVTRFPEVINEALEANEWDKDDVDLYIPHQANLRISQAVAKRLGVPEEKFYSNIQKYGNTTAASIPIAMAEAARDGSLKKGDKVVMAAFGSGFTWASAAFTWG